MENTKRSSRMNLVRSKSQSTGSFVSHSKKMGHGDKVASVLDELKRKVPGEFASRTGSCKGNLSIYPSTELSLG